MEILSDFRDIRKILETSKVVAIVGLSPKESRPSNLVGRYLLDAGYTVIPVNPGHSEIMGRTCYPNLSSIPQEVDIVDIFRRSEDVLPIVEDAIAIGAKVVWMQMGISNEHAAARAKEAGLAVIMDRCIKIDHGNIFKRDDKPIG